MAPITQQEIARSLGVSLSTVHRAFARPESVSRIVRERIFEFAGANDYRPNRSARALQGSKRHRVALFSRNTPSFFWDDVAAGARIAARQLSSLGLEFHYRRVSGYDGCIRALREVVRNGIDCIGLVNHTNMHIERIIEWVQNHNLPLAAFNIDFEDVDRLCYLGTDYVQQGRLAGEVVAKFLPEGGELGILTSPEEPNSFLAGADIQNQRFRGMKQVLEDFPGIRIKLIPIREHGVETPPERVLEALDDLPGLHRGAIVCMPTMPGFFVRYLHEVATDDRPAVVGFALSPQTTSLLEGGLISAEVYQNPSLQGYGIVRLLDTYLETGRVPLQKKYIITPQVIFSNNVNQRNVFDFIAEISGPSDK
ncbi:MAG: substrate-binding domain-containing protein [Spirochaetales bacterium]|nr:substrate-binding domain-containing protein [Spirochaetales bacterium]